MVTELQKAIADLGNESQLAQALAYVFQNLTTLGGQTPVQEEIASQTGTGSFSFGLGIVTQTLDTEKAGRIKVDSGIFPDGPQECDYVSPIGGAGYGFFAVPGIGATVLIGKTPNQNFWLGCLYAAGQRDLPNTKTQPYILGEATQLPKNEVMDNGEPTPTTPEVGYGVPNESDVYRDNYLPDSFVLKHPKGHGLTMSDKNTPERQINEIKLKSGGNKRVILSDAPAAAGGGNILLIDENSNQVRITSEGYKGITDNSIITSVGGNVEVDTKSGSISHTISNKSIHDFSIDNLGSGNVDLTAHNGHITLSAESAISLQCGSCSIEISNDKITINGPTVQMTGNQLDLDADISTGSLINLNSQAVNVAGANAVNLNSQAVNVVGDSGVNVESSTAVKINSNDVNVSGMSGINLEVNTDSGIQAITGPRVLVTYPIPGTPIELSLAPGVTYNGQQMVVFGVPE